MAIPFDDINQSSTMHSINQSTSSISSYEPIVTPVCGLPGIDLIKFNSTIVSSSDAATYYINLCGQVQSSNFSRAPACLGLRDGNVNACEISTSGVSNALAIAGVNNTNAQYDEMFVPRGVLISFDQTGSLCKQDMSRHWSFDAKLICRGKDDTPTIASIVTSGTCSQEATIYSRVACRCGLPEMDFYQIEHVYGLLLWYGPDEKGNNATFVFSPCNVLLQSPCQNMPYATRSLLCRLNDGPAASLMTYRPETTEWSSDVIGGVPVVTMVMKGPNSFNPFSSATLIVNYWCDSHAYRPFISNLIANNSADEASVVDVQTHISCFVSPLSSTGSAPSGDEGATQAHVILVIVLGALLLICTSILCVRARRHVERWSYVEEYIDQQDTLYDDTYLPPLHRLGTQESSDVEICHAEYRRIN